MKRLIAALSLPMVLAACGGAAVEPVPVDRAPFVDPASARLESGFVINGAQFNGAPFSGPVICQNLTTPLGLSFVHEGTVERVEVLLEGLATGERNTNLANIRVVDQNDADDRIAIAFESGPGAVPLSLFEKSVTPQAIVVNPTPVEQPEIVGATRLLLVAVSPSGLRSEAVETNPIPVVANCPAP